MRQACRRLALLGRTIWHSFTLCRQNSILLTLNWRSGKQAGQMRSLRTYEPCGGARVRADGRELVNFSSNDYLGLASHPLVQARAIEFVERYGTGSTASRLICGSQPGFAEVEQTLAKLKQTERALVLNSGYQANVSLLPTLVDRRALILLDRLCHNSLVQGAVLGRCRMRRYRHGDLDHLRALLAESAGTNYSRRVIVTESVFSMDGDVSDIDALVELAGEFDALLVIDEAHATGVLGERGMGLTCGKDVDVCIGTFGKALGSFGAYVACGEKLWEYLVNCCPGFIYTTALPPAVLGAVDAATRAGAANGRAASNLARPCRVLARCAQGARLGHGCGDHANRAADGGCGGRGAGSERLFRREGRPRRGHSPSYGRAGAGADSLGAQRPAPAERPRYAN